MNSTPTLLILSSVMNFQTSSGETNDLFLFNRGSSWSAETLSTYDCKGENHKEGISEQGYPTVCTCTCIMY